jgi:ketol-acid reductoisomerase
MPELARAAWHTLVEAGFSPEVAYLECVQQLRLLADLVAEHGIAGMAERVSDTAEWGALRTGPEVVGPASREAMRAALARIQSGEFAREWLAEAAAGKPRLLAARAARAADPVEAARLKLPSP